MRKKQKIFTCLSEVLAIVLISRIALVLGQTTCNNGQGRVLYERLPNQQLQGFDDDVVRDTAPPFRVLEKCQDLCLRDRTASNNLVRACTSFDFQPGSRIASFSGSAEYEESTCYLTREQAAPEGIGNLMLVPNSVHFTEVCLSSSRPERECPSRRYVFERHPRKKLKLPLSDIKEVTAANRSDCEDKCLNEFSFVCRAANFDATMRSCTMSRFTRRSHPELLEDDPNSDYLENTCLNAERRCDGLVVYVKEENKRLGGPFEVDIFNNMTLEECQSMCLRAEKYFCRSVEFDDQTKQCILSEEDSISQKDDISISSSPTHHFYDLVCLDNQRGTEYPDNSVTSHLFSNGRRPDTAFQRYRNSRLGGEFHSEITGRSLSECLDECLRQTSFQCRSAVYSDRFRTCRLSRYNQRDGMRIIYDADYDYYENLMLGGDGDGTTNSGRPDPTDWRPNSDRDRDRDRDRYPDDRPPYGPNGGRYPDDRYPGAPGRPDDRLPGRYPSDRFPSGPGGDRIPDDRYPGSPGGGRLPDDRYPSAPGGGRYPDDRFPSVPGGGRYPDDRFPSVPGGGRYPDDRYPPRPGGRPEYGDINGLGVGDRYGDRDRDRYGDRPTPGYRPSFREPPYMDRYGPDRDRYNPDGYMRPGYHPMMGNRYPADRDRIPGVPYSSERPYDGMPTRPSLYPDSRFPPDRGQVRPTIDRFRPGYGQGYGREPTDGRYPPDRGYPMRPSVDMYGSGGSYGAGREPFPERGYPMRPGGGMEMYGGMDHRYHMMSVAGGYVDRDRYYENTRPIPPVSSNRFPVGTERYPIDIYKYGNGMRERFPPSGSGYDGYERDRDYGKDRTYGGGSMFGYRPGYPDRDRGYVRPGAPGGFPGSYPYEVARPQYGFDNNINPGNGDGFGGYGPPRPLGGGGYRCDEADSYRQVASRHRMRSQYIKRAMTAPTLVHCQRECTESRDFVCRSFNFRDTAANYDSNDREAGGSNCELSDRDSREMDIQSPLMFDVANYDFYEKSPGRAGYDGDCLDVSQVCNEDGMEFTLRTPEGFVGRIYSYGYYDRCFFRGTGGTINVLRLSGPQGYPECGTQRYGDTMTNIVVVQFSDYVQTGRDKRFNLTCLFRGPGESVVTSSYIGAGSGSPIPIEYLPAENSMSSKVRLMILYQGRPTTTIAVGDPLTFRLESQDGYNHPATSGDMFATNVIARDPYSGRSVQLIDRHGCPVDSFVFPELGRSRDGDSLEARFNAFKIPESNFLVFEATVRTCRDGCQPAYCPGVAGRSEPSYGRRKRSVNGTIVGEGSAVNISDGDTIFRVNGTITNASISNGTDSANDVMGNNEVDGEDTPEYPEQVREMIEVFESREEMQQDSVARKVISSSDNVCLSNSEYNGLISSVILLIILLLSITLVAGLAYRRYWQVVLKNRATDRTSPINSFSPSALHQMSSSAQFNGTGRNGSSGRNSGLSIFGNGLQKTFATGNLSRMCQIPVMNPLKNTKTSEFDDPSEPIYTDPSLFERSRSLRSIAVEQSDEV